MAATIYDKHMHACIHACSTCFFVKYLLYRVYIYIIYINYRCTEVPGSLWMACICLVSSYIMAINLHTLLKMDHITWEMYLVLETTELNFNQVM